MISLIKDKHRIFTDCFIVSCRKLWLEELANNDIFDFTLLSSLLYTHDVQFKLSLRNF